MQQCVPGHLTFTPVLQVHLSFDFELIYNGSLTGLSKNNILFGNLLQHSEWRMA